MDSITSSENIIDCCQPKHSDLQTIDSNKKNAAEYVMFQVDESFFQEGYAIDKWDLVKILFPSDCQDSISECFIKQTDRILDELSTAIAWPSSTNPFQIHDCVSTTWSVQSPIPSIGQQLSMPIQSSFPMVPQIELVPIYQPPNSLWLESFGYQAASFGSEIDMCTPSSSVVLSDDELIEDVQELVFPAEEFYVQQ